MTDSKRWLLPDGIEELLPRQAEHIERLRREMLDLFHSWGYEMVMPPLVEYIDSLLIGRGDDLDLQTYKITDQNNGRLMGVRADITPQVARIDAHLLRRSVPARLCYVGDVLHTRQSGFGAGRAPIQVGAELYGHAGVESDVEIIHLMVETLTVTGIENIFVDLGHVGIFRAMAKASGLSAEQETLLFDALQRKAKPEIVDLLAAFDLSKTWQQLYIALVDMNGDVSILKDCMGLLAGVDAGITKALDELQKVADLLQMELPKLSIHFDFAELRGYHYKTGIVFAAFVPGHGQELARGGRYNEIGQVYGRSRPATGFSADLKTIMQYSVAAPYQVRAILAPMNSDENLKAEIKKLRDMGERVIVSLPGQEGDMAEVGCDRELVISSGCWQVRPIS